MSISSNATAVSARSLRREWSPVPLKYLLRAPLAYGVLKPEHYAGEDGVPLVRILDVESGRVKTEQLLRISPQQSREYARTVLRPGDLVISVVGTIGRCFVVPSVLSGANLSRALARVQVRLDRVDVRFLAYVFASRHFLNFVEEIPTGTAQRVLNLSDLREFDVALPPSDVQYAIANFLDRETTNLDNLINAKQRLIDAAILKRTSLIAELCTRGLGVHHSTKDSGVPPIGPVPSHWDVVRNKNLFKEIDQRSTDGSEELLTVSHITGISRRADKPEVTMFMAESLEGYKKCQKSDLIINTMWAWMGALGISGYDGIVSPGYNVYRLKRKALPAFLDLLYRTPQYIAEFTRWSKGVWESRLRLYPFEFFQIQTPLPPFEEQEKIVAAIDEKTGGVQKAVAQLEASIDRLREYRSALISAAVTGQIDVRTYRSRETAAMAVETV